MIGAVASAGLLLLLLAVDWAARRRRLHIRPDPHITALRRLHRKEHR